MLSSINAALQQTLRQNCATITAIFSDQTPPKFRSSIMNPLVFFNQPSAVLWVPQPKVIFFWFKGMGRGLTARGSWRQVPWVGPAGDPTERKLSFHIRLPTPARAWLMSSARPTRLPPKKKSWFRGWLSEFAVRLNKAWIRYGTGPDMC